MFVFFFQAEDGIRDGHVTGVQTCALPIWRPGETRRGPRAIALSSRCLLQAPGRRTPVWSSRSEERRVGKEGRLRLSTDPAKEVRAARNASNSMLLNSMFVNANCYAV